MVCAVLTWAVAAVPDINVRPNRKSIGSKARSECLSQKSSIAFLIPSRSSKPLYHQKHVCFNEC